MKQIKICKSLKPNFEFSTEKELEIYKLFVEEITRVVNTSLIVKDKKRKRLNSEDLESALQMLNKNMYI